MKKLLKVFGIFLLFFLALIYVSTFILESKIDTIVKNYADNNINAELEFDDISLNLISSFPNAEINVENLKVTNRSPFENETLATAKEFGFEMPIGELFKGSEEPLVINEIHADELLLTVKLNTNGRANYDIIKNDKKEPTPQTSKKSSFGFDIQNFEIKNSAFTYIDKQSKTNLYITEFTNSGKGIFSGTASQLDLYTEGKVSLAIDSASYLSNNVVKLEALIGLDFDSNTYTFKENKGYINALPLEFTGYVTLNEDSQEINIDFTNPESSFKDVLALIPEHYSKNIDNLNSTGNFKVDGKINGLLSDDSIPTFDIALISNNASFQYPDLPKGVKDIFIDAQIKNTTGKTKDTYIDVNTFNFRIDDDVFSSEAHIKDLTESVKVKAQLNGTLNLANITKAYPIELENQLTGLLEGELKTTFDMDAINTNSYERIKNNGQINITDFVFSSEDIVNPIQINTAELVFKPGEVSLKKFDALTGQSDFSATGTFTNLLGFLLSDKKLQGNFDVNSNKFVIGDFMVEDETAVKDSNKSSSEEESLKIPEFLDCRIKANAKTVIYDDITLENVEGLLIIKNQSAQLNSMSADLFKGKLDISGNVSTTNSIPNFDLKLGINDFDIYQSFQNLDMLSAIAPLAKVLQGKLNSTIDVRGLLDANFSPELSSIAGNAQAEINTTKINVDNSPLISGLSNQLTFLDFNNFNLKDIKTNVSFENGKVDMQPFVISYKDIPIEISGSHSFSNTMDYNAVFQVPAKYLGSDVNRLIGQINDEDVNQISIPVKATMGGTFSEPIIKTDLSSGISNLTQQLIEIQKQKLLNQGKEKIKDILGGFLGKDKNSPTETDSSKTNKDTTKIKTAAEGLLGDILGSKKGKQKKTVKDSTKND